MESQRLTDTLIRKLQAPAKGNVLYFDSEIGGFAVRVTANAKAFVFRYRAKGRQRCYTIGSFGEGWTAAAARGEAGRLKQIVRTGGDPMGDRHAEREAPTMRALTDKYLDEHVPTKRATSATEDRGMIAQHVLPRLGAYRVDAVRKADIEALHRDISKRTPTRANRVVQLLSKMFSLAIEWGYRTGNPCRGIRKNSETKRERYLTITEVERLVAALSASTYRSSADAVMLLLLTGARRNEVLGAQWSEFDLVRGWWLKPADRVKSGKPHRVALSSHAIELLKTMRAKSIDKHLFPGRRGPVQTTLKTFWRRACAQAGLQSVRLHDVRHTTASLIASGGGSLMAVQDLLGHRDPTTSRRYAHLFDSVQRQIVESVGAQIVGSGTVGGGRYDGAPEASRA